MRFAICGDQSFSNFFCGELRRRSCIRSYCFLSVANHLKFRAMENSVVGENLMASSEDSFGALCTMYRNDESEDYSYVVLLDVSKAAVVQRMLKWSGQKPVSFICKPAVLR